MKKRICFIMALASFVLLFSGITYAAGTPTNSGDHGQEPGSDVSTDVLETEEPAQPEESVEPADPDEFREDLFSDVKPGDLFFDNVKTAYELGLMKGRGEGEFAPLDSIELAEAITIAVRLRSAYLGDNYDFPIGEPWYAPMVAYATAQGIIQKGEFTDYTAAATRAQFAYILSGALPSGALKEMNTVEDNSLPDVKMDDAYASNIYFLYRAGILLGNDEKGTFSPSSTINRAESAAIASRIASEPLRVKCEFYAPPVDQKPAYPDLSLRPRADDSFFADTAILGNSLIDGLRVYSKLKTVDFYCGTSMSVISAMNSKNVLLNNGTKGTQLDAMAQKQYGKVYIELGINEIYLSTDSFIKYYRTMLDIIRAAQPDAEIYIMAITPTGRARNGTPYNRDRVIMYNAALYRLAADWGCWYLDDFTPLTDSEGYLPNSYTSDGVHLYAARYADWEAIIRTYYA